MGDDRARVVVVTGSGESWSAGMDLKEYFREVEEAPPHVEVQARRDSAEWQWRRLIHFPKPTIAMVNGWCFGGAFTPLVCCDWSTRQSRAIGSGRGRRRWRGSWPGSTLASSGPQRWDSRRPGSCPGTRPQGKQQGLSQFLDSKSFRPGLGAYERSPD